MVVSNTKFKSGDKVVFCKSSLESGMIDAKEGDVFTVHTAGVIHVLLEELGGVYHVTHFEHYVEKERVVEKKFAKVGDKIRIVHPTGSVGCYEAGDVLEVVDTHEDWVGVDVVIEDGGFFHVYHTEYEVIEEEIVLESNSRPQPEISHEDSRIDWQGSQINWQVGQEVWDVRNGRGIVKSTEYEGGYPIFVEFDLKDFDGKNVTDCYTSDGRYAKTQTLRSLFFSEPKIIAETKPPKKPFVPVLKEGVDVFIKIKSAGFGEGTVRTVYKETEDRIYISEAGYYFLKRDIESVRVLSEQIKFS